MICHEYKCIYIHQRKAAGSSIIREFGILPDQKDWHLFNEGTLSFSQRHGHWQDRPRDYLVVTSVRNPWDRFVSAWRYLPHFRDLALADALRSLPRSPRQIPLHYMLERLQLRTGGSKFVDRLYLRSLRRRELSDYRHLARPQMDILADGGSACVADVVLRFEHLQEDWGMLRERLGMPDRELPLINATVHEPYATYYNDATREAVGNLFRRDIETFGYKFE